MKNKILIHFRQRWVLIQLNSLTRHNWLWFVHSIDNLRYENAHTNDLGTSATGRLSFTNYRTTIHLPLSSLWSIKFDRQKITQEIQQKTFGLSISSCICLKVLVFSSVTKLTQYPVALGSEHVLWTLDQVVPLDPLPFALSISCFQHYPENGK